MPGTLFGIQGRKFQKQGQNLCHQERNIEVRGAILGPPGAEFFNYVSPGGGTCPRMQYLAQVSQPRGRHFYQKCHISNPGGTILTKNVLFPTQGVRILIKYVLFTTQGPGRIVWPQVRQICTSQTEKFSRYTLILYFSPIQY